MHFLTKVHVREFCAYCIQTEESFTWHVKLKRTVYLQASKDEEMTYDLQAARLQMREEDGNMTEAEFRTGVQERISKTCDVFAKSPMVVKYFEDLGYFVELLRCIPKNLPRSIITRPCARAHRTCAQKVVHGIALYLRPAFVPYLNTELIKEPVQYVDNAYKYGSHKLMGPLYKSLEPVDLLKLNNPPDDCSEHCTEGATDTPMSVE
jgi:hypothetical protein